MLIVVVKCLVAFRRFNNKHMQLMKLLLVRIREQNERSSVAESRRDLLGTKVDPLIYP